MTAQTVTGKGFGNSNKMNINEIIRSITSIQKTIDQMPKIAYTASKETENVGEEYEAVFTLPAPTPKDADAYVIFTATEDGSAIDSYQVNDNDEGQLTEISVITSSEITVSVMVVENGRLLT